MSFPGYCEGVPEPYWKPVQFQEAMAILIGCDTEPEEINLLISKLLVVCGVDTSKAEGIEVQAAPGLAATLSPKLD